MSFQAYLDSIKAKTGLDPADFARIAGEKGLLADGVPAGRILAWLAEDYDLGRGHGMALVATMKPVSSHGKDPAELVAATFTGAKAVWRPSYDRLLVALAEFGPVATQPTNSYISLLRGEKKFAILAVTAERMDIGIKLKGADATDRFEASGTWNSMVTHRVRITAPEQVDSQVLDWLGDAYAAAA